MRWAPANDADKYIVKVSWSGGSSSSMTTTNSYPWTPTGTAKLNAANGPFTWTVQSVDHNGDSSPVPFQGSPTFSISGAIPTTTAPALSPLTPASNASPSARFPELTWEPTAGAAYYQVHIGTAGGIFFGTLGDKFPYPAGTDDTDDYLAPGSYEWFVTAFASNGSQLGTAGTHATFAVRDPAPVTGQRLALDGSGLDSAGTSCANRLADPDPIVANRLCGGLTATPVLDWEPVPDAGYYMVYLSRDRQMTNLVTPPTITQNSRWTPLTALPDSQAGDAYYWFIRPCKAPGVCAPEPTLAGHAFDKRSNIVDQGRRECGRCSHL